MHGAARPTSYWPPHWCSLQAHLACSSNSLLRRSTEAALSLTEAMASRTVLSIVSPSMLRPMALLAQQCVSELL